MWGCKATLTWLIASAGLLALAGCGGKSADGNRPQAEHTPTPVAAALPVPALDSTAVPFPSDRSASGLTETLIQGKNADLRSAGATEQGTALVLDATAGAVQYAGYRFNLGGNPPDSVSVLLENAGGSSAFIGLANFTTQRWDLSGPYSAAKTLAIDGGDYISPSGNVWIAIVVPVGQSATVESLSVRTINPDNLPPVAALTADVTSGNAPLTVNFDASGSHDPDGSIIEYAWDFDGDGAYEAFTDAPLIAHTYAAPGAFAPRVRVTDDELARSAPASVPIAVNAPPVAVLIADPLAVDKGGTVNLDASDSHDPDGTLADYAWDLNGNGVFGEPGPEAAAAQQTYVALTMSDRPGPYSVGVRVTDNSGAQGTASVTLTVHGWLLTDIDTGASASSLAIVDGCPAIAYAVDNLRFARATVPDGDGAWTISTIAKPAGYSWNYSPSLAVVNGHPLVAFADVGQLQGDINCAACTAVDGSGAWNVAPVCADGNANELPTLCDVAGSAGVAFNAEIPDYPFLVVKFAHEVTQSPTGSWTVARIDNDNTFAQAAYQNSLCSVEGQPAVVYSRGDGTTYQFVYARSSTADGLGAWNTNVIGGDSSSGAIAVVNGHPMACFNDVDNSELRLMYSPTATGDGPWGSTGLAAEFDFSAQLATVSGHPTLLFDHQDVAPNDQLTFAQSPVLDGSSGWSVAPLDTDPVQSYSSSLANVNGHAAISYCTSGPDPRLVYAILY